MSFSSDNHEGTPSPPNPNALPWTPDAPPDPAPLTILDIIHILTEAKK